MASQSSKPEVTRAILLSSRDVVYLFSLLIPFVVYDLTLKGILIFSAPQDPEVAEALGLMQIRLTPPPPPTFFEGLRLMQSDLFFKLGYVLLWYGLFAVARTGAWRRIVVGLFHGLTICFVLISTIAFQYFVSTGSTLSFDTLILGLSSLEDMRGLIASEVYIGPLLAMLAMLVYALFGPRLITSAAERWYGSLDARQADRVIRWRHSLRLLALWLVAGGLFWLSVLPGVGVTGVSKAFARDAIVNVMMTAGEVGQDAELATAAVDLPPEQLPLRARLQATPSTSRRNVVLIVLESTRAAATTPYNKELRTTPFLDQLSRRSLLVEQAYAIIPHTHNALTAINCGIYPPLDPSRTGFLATPGSLPHVCLPHLLGAEGYTTAFFMSQTSEFESSQQILENLGYQHFTSLEDMNTAGFEPTNYFGVEDEVLLEPSREWLRAHRDEPFLVTYLTSAPHHDYLAPSRRHGRVAFTDNDLINRYLNSVRNQDFFVKQLFEQYRQLGLYENTVFILLGDHGQGFGEHGRNGHDNAIYEEGLRVPLLIHDPQVLTQGRHLEGPVSQLDILPTVADLLGLRIAEGPYSGSSLLRPLPDDRTLLFSCSGGESCMASLTGGEKYIDHFDDRPAELFDLAADPMERNNLAAERAPAELERRRVELLAWRAEVRAVYDALAAQ